MVDFARWIGAQLSADEAAAEDTLSLHVRAGRFRGVEVQRWRITQSGEGIIDEDGGTVRAQQIFPAEAAHVIRHDPARVLREIDAKRQLVKLHGRATLRAGGLEQYFATATVCRSCEPNHQFPEMSWPCPTLRLLALPYADRPGYRDDWRL